MVSSSSSHGGVGPNLNLDKINEELKAKKPSELVDIFRKAVKNLNGGDSS